MSVHFNPPPNWPEFPEGFEPGPDWRPFPEWGAPPTGWSVWIDDEGRPVNRGGQVQRAGFEPTNSPNSNGWAVALVLVLGIIGLIVGYQPVSLLSGSGILYVGLALAAAAAIVAFAMKLRPWLRIVSVIGVVLVGVNIGVVEQELSQKRAALRADLAGIGFTAGSRTGASHTVVYTVTGSSPSGTITYLGPSGEQQESDQELPWAHTATVQATGVFVLSAQNPRDDSTPVTCAIAVDGKTVASNSSQGAYAVVSCNAALP